MTKYVPGSLYEQAVNIGLKEGEKKGREQEKVLQSLNILLMLATALPNVSINFLSKSTKLSVKKVKTLLTSFQEDGLVDIHKQLKKTLFSKFDLTKQETKEISTLIKAYKKSRKPKSSK